MNNKKMVYSMLLILWLLFFSAIFIPNFHLIPLFTTTQKGYLWYSMVAFVLLFFTGILYKMRKS